jgi:hypothetical protein
VKLTLIVLKDKYAIKKLHTNSDIPDWVNDSDFYSVTKTRDELSIVCKQQDPIKNVLNINKDWKILKLRGPLDFSSIGIIAAISGILKKNKIPIFTISTYETDYILVKNDDLNKTAASLKAKGYQIIYEK